MHARHFFKLLPIVALCLSAAVPNAASARERARFIHPNADGGATAGRLAGGAGPNGGGFLRGRRTQGDGQGNVTSTSGGAFRGPNGASGERGSVQSQGNVSRTADGAVSGERTSSATGANGNTYQGSTSNTKGEGVSHSGTCSDAAGNGIPCAR